MRTLGVKEAVNKSVQSCSVSETIKMEQRDGDSCGLTILEEMENIETMLEGKEV